MTLGNWITIAEITAAALIVAVSITLAFRIPKSRFFRAGLGLALLGGFLVLWVNLAVGIIGEAENPANLMYLAVPALGAACALLLRFRPHAMFLIMFVMSIAQIVVGLITLFLELGNPPTPAITFIIFNLILASIWAASAACFRKSGSAQLLPASQA